MRILPPSPLGALLSWNRYQRVSRTGFVEFRVCFDIRTNCDERSTNASRRCKGMDHGKLIAVRMEEARDARGISVAELARRASIDRKRLWYILDGQRQMRADEFVRLCAVMGLDMKFFLTPELREELAWRRQKTIEDYGTGLCGLPTLREKGDARCSI